MNAGRSQSNSPPQVPLEALAIASPSSSSCSHQSSSMEKLDHSNEKEICHWNAAEEAVLVHALIKEQVAGRQIENGFKPQAWRNAFEEGRRKGVRPKTIEQLKSRWQRLKKEYRIVKALRNSPGFAWDEKNALIVADGISWERYLEKHTQAKPFRKKAFPLYDAIAGLVERDDASTPFDVPGVDPLRSFARSASIPRSEGSNTPPLSRDYIDDDSSPSLESGGMRCGNKDPEEMSDDEDTRNPMEVAHIMNNFRHQDFTLPKLRPIKPTEFPNPLTLPSLRGIKRLSPDVHDNRSSSSLTNGYLYPVTTEDNSKRRRLDVRSAGSTWPTRGYDLPSNPSQPLVTAAEPQPPGSSYLHQLSQSLNNLVSFLSEQTSSGSLGPPSSWNERTRIAWDTVVETETLTEAELASARRVFRGNAGLADEYLSFPARCRGARTLWLMREIREVERNLC